MKRALLTRNNLKVCQSIAEQEDEHGARAKMLLALHGGALQAQAAAESGLTPGQVRYWVAKFRRNGLGIFPDELTAAPAPDPQPAEEPEAEEQKTPKAKPKKKKKKTDKKSGGKKKGKKKPGKKKSKKDKKSDSKKKGKGGKKGKKSKKGKKKGKK